MTHPRIPAQFFDGQPYDLMGRSHGVHTFEALDQPAGIDAHPGLFFASAVDLIEAVEHFKAAGFAVTFNRQAHFTVRFAA